MAARDVTYSNPAGNLATGAFASGLVLADASDPINVLCGFKPSKVELYYKDSGGTANKIVIWVKGMTEDVGGINDEYALIGDAGDVAFPGSGGILIYEGDADNTEGFTIAAALMDADNDNIFWVAHR